MRFSSNSAFCDECPSEANGQLEARKESGLCLTICPIDVACGGKANLSHLCCFRLPGQYLLEA
jgi:hypothetical protein